MQILVFFKKPYSRLQLFLSVLYALDIFFFAPPDQLSTISTALCSRRLNYMNHIKDFLPSGFPLSPSVEGYHGGWQNRNRVRSRSYYPSSFLLGLIDCSVSPPNATACKRLPFQTRFLSSRNCFLPLPFRLLGGKGP